jgi:signal peptidase I
LRSRTGIIIGAIIIIVAAASAVALLQGPSSNTTINSSNQQATQNLEQLHQIGITVKTDGNSVKVNATSVPTSVEIPAKMITEMKNKAYKDVQSYKSTVSSLKTDMQTIAKKYNFTANVTITSQFGTDQLPFSAVVDGTSMLPTLKDGQDVTAVKTNKFKVGDIVIARHPTYGLIIKRVATIANGKVFLKSDNRNVVTYNVETPLSDGVVEIETFTKKPVDTWQPVKNVIGVVKTY